LNRWTIGEKPLALARYGWMVRVGPNRTGQRRVRVAFEFGSVATTTVRLSLRTKTLSNELVFRRRFGDVGNVSVFELDAEQVVTTPLRPA